MVTRAELAVKAVKEVVLTRVIDAPREVVFEAWTRCEHLVQWLAPNGYTIPRCEADPRPGGAFNITMRAPDGTDHNNKGIYREVVPPQRLVFSGIVDDRLEDLNTVTFEPQGGRTLVTLTARVVRAVAGAELAQLFLDGMDQGWNESLDHLVKQAVTMRKGRELVLTRVFDAPRSLVWEASTKCEHLKNWWGPRRYALAVCELDLRPGGSYRFVQRDAQGNEHPFKGEYLEVVAPERLVLTFIYDVPVIRDSAAVVTMTFEDQGGKTKLTSRTTFPTAEAYQGAVTDGGMESGARESWDRLAELVAVLRQRK